MTSKVMYRIYFNCILLSIVLLILNTNLNHGITFKMTNLVCSSYNKSWLVISQCRLKAVQRNKTILNLDLELLYPATEIYSRWQILRKANGYKPWLIDISYDACKFLRRPNNPVIKTIFGIFKDFSTFNHSCPYEGHQAIRNFYPNIDNFPIPFPTGDYLLFISYNFSKHEKNIDVKVYFSYVEGLI